MPNSTYGQTTLTEPGQAAPGTLPKKNWHPTFRAWLILNGLTWFPLVLAYAVYGLVFDIYNDYESMALLGLIFFIVYGLVISIILAFLLIGLRNLRKPRLFRIMFIIFAVIGIGANLTLMILSFFGDKYYWTNYWQDLEGWVPLIVDLALMAPFVILAIRLLRATRGSAVTRFQPLDEPKSAVGRFLHNERLGVVMILVVLVAIGYGVFSSIIGNTNQKVEENKPYSAVVKSTRLITEYQKRFSIVQPSDWLGGNIYDEDVMKFGSGHPAQGWSQGGIRLLDNATGMTPDLFGRSQRSRNPKATEISNVEKTTIDGHAAAIIYRRSPVGSVNQAREVDAYISYPPIIVEIRGGTTDRTEWSGGYAVDWPTTQQAIVDMIRTFHWLGAPDTLRATRYTDPLGRFSVYNKFNWTFQQANSGSAVLFSGQTDAKNMSGKSASYTMSGTIEWLTVSAGTTPEQYLAGLPAYEGANRKFVKTEDMTVDLKPAVFKTERGPANKDSGGNFTNNKYTTAIPYDDVLVVITVIVQGEGYETAIKYDLAVVIESFERIIREASST